MEEIMNNGLKEVGAKITSRRVSFKLNFDGTYSENRVIFKIEPSTDNIIKHLMELYTSDKKIIEYMIRRNNEENGDFGMLIDEESVRFYIDSPFSENSEGIFSVLIKNGISTKRVYSMEKITNTSKYNMLLPIFSYLDMNIVMSRNDGQDYIRVNRKIPYEKFLEITNHQIMIKWIKKYCDTYLPVWIQISDSSLTLYYKID